ncbi:MAG: porin [Thermoanaerobaculia bacterium]
MRKALLRAAALCAFAAAVTAVPGRAQVMGLFYQEVEQDDRVYVFNTAEAYERFTAGGEMGVSVTLVGRAEGGKTLVGDNETAIDLYLFKHDLPPYERPTVPFKKVEDYVNYKDGKLSFKFPAGEVALSNRLQARYTQAEVVNGPDVGSFRLRRMKTTIEGSIYKVWRFKLQGNWVGGDVVQTATFDPATQTLTTTRGRDAVLEDAEIWYARNPLATIWLGQGKAYYGRQQLTSSGRLQFVDRTVYDGRFHPGRDQGIGLIGVNQAKTFEYNLGIYNGNQLNRTANDNDEFMLAGRAIWTPFGEYKLEESSLDYPTTPKLAIGVGFLENTTGTETSTSNSKVDISRVGAEVAFKLRGFNLVGEYVQEESEPQATNVATDIDGFYAQLGYLFPNQKFELAGRYSDFSSDDVVSSAFPDLTETGGALSWYFAKHNHKLQGDVIEIERDTGSGPVETTEVRLQLQLIF